MMAAITKAAAKSVALTCTKLEVKLAKNLASLPAKARSSFKLSCAETEAKPIANTRAQFWKAFIILIILFLFV